jgi:hypothetical protein
MKFPNMAIALTVILLCFAEAHGQSDRTFVATTGINSDTCGTSTSPCRSFTTALGKTNPRGEIIALDSGLYDTLPVNVTTSITLTAANGVHAELPGITVNTTTNDTVILRNLYLSSNPSIASNEGIKVTSVGALHIENCIVNGFPTGISFSLNAAAEAFINDSVVRNSNGNGISFSTNAGLLKAAVNHCRIENNGHFGPIADGLSVLKRGRVTVRDTVSTGNNGAGFVVTGGELTLENCEATDNGDGVIAASSETQNGNVLVSNSTVTNNSRNGFLQEGTGVFNSLGNNLVRRNGTNTSGTINVISGT